MRPSPIQRTLTPSQGGNPLTAPSEPNATALEDAQILRLVDGLPNTTMGRCYRFALELMATYGLSPAELRYLHVRNNATELWSRFKTGRDGPHGGETELRRLEPLKVVDQFGTPQHWNLLERVAMGERLPPLGADSEAQQHLDAYLSKNPIWTSIQEEAARDGRRVDMDSFRRRHQAGNGDSSPSATGEGMGNTAADISDDGTPQHVGNCAGS